MNGTYQTNYYNKLKREGREVRIADYTMSYFYSLAEGDTREDAALNFAISYDFGEEPSDVQLDITEYLDGEEIGWSSRIIRPLLP